MITLITGTPGAGKTLYTVHSVLSKEAEGNRPIFVDGIPDLALRHEPAQDVNEWHKWAPDGALIVVDEVQRIWRPAGSGAKVPDSIAELETHRHRGIDFVVITQHPNLMHQNIRRLVGKHLHLRRTAFGVYLYEWPECANPDSYKTAHSKIRWSHPKKAFGLYKSASQHVKVSHRMPAQVYVIGLGALSLIYGTWYLYNSISSKVDPSKAQPAAAAPGQDQQQAQAEIEGQQNTPDQFSPFYFMPKYPGKPASAPAYENMLQVVSAPKVTACIASPTKCICYTQQQTRVDVDEAECRERAAGLYFDPYKPDEMIAQRGPMSLTPRPQMQQHQPPGQDLISADTFDQPDQVSPAATWPEPRNAVPLRSQVWPSQPS